MAGGWMGVKDELSKPRGVGNVWQYNRRRAVQGGGLVSALHLNGMFKANCS